MRFEQRMFARLKFLEKLAELSENAFENFFQDLMCALYPDFVDVRTHGNLGDLGADGLTLHDRQLYACYAPSTFDASAIELKFKSDLQKAINKRSGQFDTFVFVHNDMRGTHPEIAAMLAEAQRAHKPLNIEIMGRRRLWQKIMKLDLAEVEDLLGCPIPITDSIYGIGMEDLEPLLDHLKTATVSPDPLHRIPQVSEEKLDYNELDGDSRESLVKAMKSTHLIDEYYDLRIMEIQRKEVAEGFRIYYQQVREAWTAAEDILWQLEMYVLGNMRHDPRTHRAAQVILAYFFERCDIFEQPPADWRPSTTSGDAT
ncbi:ABC-three component system protein [Microbispora siamensis]|uniref:ABC-three component systems C-terminal domain-containing protein n=1 Tax=Microbispora siamensis TaxID=564413 RepID=A0ABQ4GLI2_9ACTN|nr:ABC-three component system protein [Microbispora siamensis]GIH62230.1 hypothetical protein Msi02_30470 [Microbispora siamensis]